MKMRTLSSEKVRDSSVRLFSLPALAALAVLYGILSFPLTLSAQEKPGKDAPAGKHGQTSAGIYFNAEASAKDVGLPIYPGARPHKDKDEDQASAKFGLWANAFAFKLAVVKLESSDSPEKVAAFYKKALAKYGTVLDCRDASSRSSDKEKSGSSKLLNCDSDKPDPGHMEFKAGTKEKQHIVGIQPNGGGSLFQLVYVESPDSDKEIH
jgi:hypothetical protein